MRRTSTASWGFSSLAPLAAGPLAALLLIANDAALIRITFGVWAPATPRIVLFALGAGLILGASLWLAWTVGALLSARFGRPWLDRPTAIQIFAFTFALLYLLSTWLRFERVGLVSQIHRRAPELLALVLWLVTCFVFQRIAAAADRGWLGVLCSGFFLAVLLVGNRELVDRPTSPGALLFDGLTMLAMISLIVVLRSRVADDTARDRVAAVAATTSAVLLLAFAATVLVHRLDARSRLEEARSAAPSTDSPHVVLLVFDTMRRDVFDDVLANTREGRAFAEALGPITWFDQAVAAASWTGPSMASVFTGLHPLQHQIRGSWEAKIPKDEPILAEFLRSSGYQTLGVVANRSLVGSIGTERGFHIYEGLEPAEALSVLGPLRRRVFGGARRDGGPESWFVDARQARRVLEKRLDLVDPSRPVFLWYHLMDVHEPLRDHSDLPASPGNEGLDAKQISYRNSARFALAETALALRTIKARLPPDNTLTLVLSDHGEMLAADNQSAPRSGDDEPRTTLHGHAYYDTVVHVPLGVQLPSGSQGGPQREIGERLVSHLDIVPTVLDAIGSDWPRPLLGCSLVPLVVTATGEEPEHCHPFVVSDGNLWSTRHSSLRTTRIKLMASPKNAFEPLLYDLSLDPGEQVDRSQEEPEALASALTLLRSYWEQYTSDRPAAAGELDPAQLETLRALGYL